MSGIFGLILKNSSSRAENAADYEEVLRRLSHRGPDSRKIEIEESVVLGACLSRHTPESKNEVQPLIAPSLSLSVVLDGRLDARERLLEELNEPGLDLSLTDPALAAAAYRRWDIHCPERLYGDFALAVWDKSSRRLFLARDAFGVKPLYYYEDAEKLCFASEILPLCALAGISPRPQDETVLDLVLGENRDAGRTFFHGVRQVPPGCLLSLSSLGKAEVRRWWNPPENFLELKDPREYEERFFTVFRDACADRMRSTTPLGVCLSGGLDSIQAASMAADLRRERPWLPRLAPVTWQFHGFLRSDRDAIKNFEARYAEASDFFDMGGENPDRSNMEFFNGSGESPSPDVLTTQPELFRRLAEKGCRAAWTGFGGNELGFYPTAGHLQDLARSFRLPSLFMEAQKAAHSFGHSLRGVMGWIAGEAAAASLPGGLKRLHKKRRQSFLRNMLETRFREASEEVRDEESFYPDLARELCRRQLMDPWFACGLAQIDHAAAKHSLHAVHPFLDRRVVEFVLRVPGREHTRRGCRKMFFQKALEPVVAGPLRETDDDSDLEADGGKVYSAAFQQERLKFYLSSPDAFIYTYVRYSAVRKLLDDEKNYWRYHSWLWRLARLECWAQKNLINTKQEAVHERHHFGLSAS